MGELNLHIDDKVVDSTGNESIPDGFIQATNVVHIVLVEESRRSLLSVLHHIWFKYLSSNGRSHRNPAGHKSTPLVKFLQQCDLGLTASQVFVDANA